jgi:hypothetical protein
VLGGGDGDWGGVGLDVVEDATIEDGGGEVCGEALECGREGDPGGCETVLVC